VPTSEPPTTGDRQPPAEPLTEDPTVLLRPRLDSPTVPLRRPAATPQPPSEPAATPPDADRPEQPDVAGPDRPDSATPAAAADPHGTATAAAGPGAGAVRPADLAGTATTPADPEDGATWSAEADGTAAAPAGRAIPDADPGTRETAGPPVALPATDPGDVPIAADGPTIRLHRPSDAPREPEAAPADAPGGPSSAVAAGADPGTAADRDVATAGTAGTPDAGASSGAPDAPVPVPPDDPDPGAARDGRADPAPDRAAADVDLPPTGNVDLPPTRVRPDRGPLSSGTVLIAVLLALFGFVLVVQLRSTNADAGLSAARQEDLVRILSDLQAREQRLNDDIAALETTRQQLASGVEGRQAALAEAERRAKELGLLAGTLPARGPGLKMTVVGAEGKPVKAAAMLNAVQELRGAGSEVIQLSGSGGTMVRVIASTAFVDDGNGLVVGGTRLSGPYELTVIGSPKILVPALNIAGGAVTGFERDGGTVNIVELDAVEVTATREPADLKYARPVS
jgi:uncharacterized protein YlxW (UPF0749 family)